MKPIHFHYFLFILIIITLIASCGDPQEQLFQGVTTDDVDRVNRALKRGADINLSDDNGETPLMIAASRGDPYVPINLLRNAVESGVIIQESNYTRAYQIARSMEHWKTASTFHSELYSAEGVEGTELQVIPREGLSIYERPELFDTQLARLPEGTLVTLIHRSLIETELNGIGGYWVFVRAQADGNHHRGWIFDAFLAPEQQEVLIMEDRVVVSRDGLNMRDAPSPGANRVLTIPGGGWVTLISEEGDEIVIGGKTGRWSYVEWRNAFKGWVFGGFLEVPQEERQIWLSWGFPFLAHHSFGVYGTDAGVVIDEEIQFSRGNEVEFMSTQYYIDGKSVITHRGIYYMEGSSVFLKLADGVETTEMDELFDYGESGPPATIPGFTMELVKLDDPQLSGPFAYYMKIEDLNMVRREGFSLNVQENQYRGETMDEFFHIGYFYQSGK